MSTEEGPEEELFCQLRTAALEEESVRCLCTAIVELGHTSLNCLLMLTDEETEDFFDSLAEGRVIEKGERKIFKEWLKERRSGPLEDFRASHFRDFKTRLNDSDASGIEAATVLCVDIDPTKTGSKQLPEHSLRVPFGIIDKQVQRASARHIPVVSMLGATGTGKSFLTSSFTGRSTTEARPMVAKPNQHIPTSANVCVHRGQVHPDSNQENFQVVCFDFEGEDGKTPKTLIDKRKMQMKRFLHNISDGAVEALLDESMAKRNEIIKQVLPPLAYLISDVVLFIDTVEPRRTERVDRIREFAEMAHKSVESLSWRPALVIVQNKWIRTSASEKAFDITSEYDWIVTGLESVFSSVRVIRIPPMADTHYFEEGMFTLHNAVKESAELIVEARTKEEGLLCSEREFWFNFNAMVKQFQNRGNGQMLSSLGSIVSGNRASRHPADNALKLLKVFGEIPQDAKLFHQRVNCVLAWYAYSLAGEARRSEDEGEVREGLQGIYNKVLGVCLPHEPCTATMMHNGKQYNCTQRRSGHGGIHTNPAMLKTPAQNLFKWAFSLGFWKDKMPCAWNGNMTSFQSKRSYRAFKRTFDRFVAMDTEEYQKASRILFGLSESVWQDVEDSSFCLLCLRAGQDLILLPDTMRHPLCRDCTRFRKTISTEDDQLICPFCHSSCTLRSGSPDDNGFRVLSLDGGGVRGLIEIFVLKKLEKQFSPLTITDLFDVIIGTSAGGIISMAMLAKVPLVQIEELMTDMAKSILDVNGLTKGFRLLTNQPVCDTVAFEKILMNMFGERKRTKHFQDSKPPYLFCTAYNPIEEETVLMGNFPVDWDYSSTKFLSMGCDIWRAARSTSAAPTYFSPQQFKGFPIKETLEDGTARIFHDTIELVDGGITANCPAKIGVRLAQELQLHEKAERGTFLEMVVSIGTGAEEPTAARQNANFLEWGKRLINVALDSEKKWEELLELIRNDQMLREVPVLRVNPPKLGSLDPFKSKSIKSLKDGMNDYFESPEGTNKMNELFHMTFAKLWQIRQRKNPVVGEPMPFSIVMRESICDFAAMGKEDLLHIIEARSDEEKHVHDEDLAKEAERLFHQKPLVPPLLGCFVCQIGGDEMVLAHGARDFTFLSKAAGPKLLYVAWRSEKYGDFPVSGFPRMIEVLPKD